MKNAMRALACAAHTAAACSIMSDAALAHPHVWVTVRDTVLYDRGTITGVKHQWTFDDAYTAMAIEGLDKNGDGIYSRDELSELAQVNIDGMKDFDYFTFAKAGTANLPFSPPRDYWLDYTNNILTLHFTVLLAKPVPANTKDLTISVLDSSYFIDFEFAKDKPVSMSSEGKDCAANVRPLADDADQQNLTQAFGSVMSPAVGAGPGGEATGYSNTIEVKCAH
jgi:ABC-type uncharacterized transport system substrate-binding protein